MFPDGSYLIAHMPHNVYTSPDGIVCNNGCFKFFFNKNYFDRYIWRISSTFKFEKFYLIGEDFYFTNAISTFEYIDYVL